MDKELLFKYRVAEGEVVIPNVITVRVRGLTRAEAFKVQEMGAEEGEAYTMHLAMVDPKLTIEEIKRWQNNSPAYEIEPVTDKIKELSGSEISEKQAMNSFRDESGAGVRVFSSAETIYDSQRDAPANE